MSALTYLSLTRLKNAVRDLFQKPARLIYVVALFLLLVLSVQGARSGQIPEEVFRDPRELVAIATALFLFIFLFTVWNGFSKGGTIFSLSDVNLLFPSPIRRTRALFYGLFRQIIVTLLLGLFIFYQYGWLYGVYGITVSTMVMVFLFYVIAVFLGQVTAMTIYTFTSSRLGVQRVLKGIILAGLAFLLVWLGWGAWTSPADQLAGLVGAANGLPVHLFPVGGWLGWSFSAFLGLGPWWPGLALCLALFLVILFLLTHFDQDWYEDVLRTAELAQSAIAAKKEGTMEAVPGKVRVGAMGLKGGWGASAFYYKHKIENRRGGILLLPPVCLIFAVVLIAFSFFTRSGGILPVFFLSVYLQLFSAGQSRINRELYKPFVYLVPEPPLAKLLQCLRELLPSVLTEAIVVFVPVGLILGLGPVEIVVCVFARVSYALLFQSGNLLLERFWSGASKALVFFLYFLILILLTLPGILIALALMVGLGLPGGPAAGLLTAGIVNIPVALGLLYLLRNMLQYAEYTH